MAYDDIIVGAGSAGAVLAARLSEDAGRRVLLLEAGPDYPSLAQTPPDLLDGKNTSLVAHDWGWAAEAVPGRALPYYRGKVVGGSSAVNGTIALRGLPADYDAWAALGNDAWGWPDVLPYFRRLEDDLDFPGELHGAGGPIPIRRYRPEEWTPLARAFAAACRRLDLAEAADHNDPASSGVGPFPLNQRDGLRVSTAVGYLLPARGRPNLAIRPHALVTEVLFEGDRAVGVAVAAGSAVERVYGRRVTLAAGALGSPAILLRSGLGPAAELARLGIAPRVDLPGVGANLQEHPLASTMLVPKAGVCDPANPSLQVLARLTAPGSPDAADLQVFLVNQLDLTAYAPEAARALGVPLVASIGASLVRPRSRGRLSLAGADPHLPPRVELHLLADPEDRRRLAAGLRWCWRLATSPELRPYVERVPFWTAEVVASDDALEAALMARVGHLNHAVGTAKMGPASDPTAVVDQYGRVRGVAGLRVADAAIMPAIPRANPNLTCILIGERVADWLRREDGPGGPA